MFHDLTETLSLTFSWTVFRQSFCQTLHYYNLPRGLEVIPGLVTLTLLQGHRCVRTINSPLFLRVYCSLNVNTLKRSVTVCFVLLVSNILQWTAADASDENTELKGSPFKAWSRSVYSHTCYAYCQGFLLANFYPSGPFACIFCKISSEFFLC